MKNKSFIFFVILIFLSYLSAKNYLKNRQDHLQKEVAGYFSTIPNAQILSLWETGTAWVNVLGVRKSYSVVVNWGDRYGNWTSLMRRGEKKVLEEVFTFDSKYKKLFLKKTTEIKKAGL